MFLTVAKPDLQDERHGSRQDRFPEMGPSVSLGTGGRASPGRWCSCPSSFGRTLRRSWCRKPSKSCSSRL